MILVVIESPYAANTPDRIIANVNYAKAAVRDCLKRGESPYVSHLLLTQVKILRDEIPEERDLGLKAGWSWYRAAEKSVVYTDRGISDGMKKGIQIANDLKLPIEYRSIEKHCNGLNCCLRPCYCVCCEHIY